MPKPEDGAEVWRLVKEAGTLDLNSSYSYIMLCDIFAGTCSVARKDGRLVGFASAYRRPDRQDTLFVWQLAVERGLRGQGLGKRMVKELLEREANADIRYVEATIGPDNIASRKVFLGLAEEKGGRSVLSEHYPAAMFPDGEAHGPELLLRIGPLKQN